MKEYLSQRGISYAEIDVSASQVAAREMMRRSGQTGVPVTIIDDQVVVGFDKAKLDAILSARKHTRPVGPSLGISVAAAAKTTQAGAGRWQGAYVGKVVEGSPGQRAGLRAGDVIVSLNGMEVTGPDQLHGLLEHMSVGDSIAVTFRRGQEQLKVTTTL